MNRRSFFSVAVACAGTLAGLGVAQAMPVATIFEPMTSLGQSSGSLDLAGDAARVEKAAVIITRRVVVRRVRPRRVIVRRTIVRRVIRRM